MKLRKSLQILNEKTYELNISKRDVIERLMLQQGSCHQNGIRIDYVTHELAFTCDKNGNFKIYEDVTTTRQQYLVRAYFMCGEVLEENGKTKVKVYTVRDRASIICKNIVPVSLPIIIGLYIAFPFIMNIPFWIILPFLFLTIYRLVVDIVNTKKEFAQKDGDLNAMSEAIDRRIEAVKRWDD